MLNSYCFVMFSWDYYLIYDLLCSGPWFGLIGSSWPVLCHGWHWGVALYWCGEISFRLFLFHFFSSSLGRNPFFWKEICPCYHIFLFVLGCLPFILFLGSLTTLLVWFCCIPYFSGIFLQLFSFIKIYNECLVNRLLLDMLLTLLFSILKTLLDVLGNVI